MTHTVSWWHIVHAYPCPTCLAAPGEPCSTTCGHPKHEPHAARSRLASADGWHNPDDPEHESEAER